MHDSRFRALATPGLALGLGLVALGACHTDTSPAGLSATCSLNSDCNSPLVCVFSRCHNACVDSGDCPSGERCVPATGQYNVCQLPSESTCADGGSCESTEVCGSDGQCRAPCTTAQDCPGSNAGGEACVTLALETGGSSSVCAVESNAFDTPVLVEAGLVTVDGAVVTQGASVASGVGGMDGATPSDGSGVANEVADGTLGDGAPAVGCTGNFTIGNVAFYGGTGTAATTSSTCATVNVSSSPTLTATPYALAGSGNIEYGAAPDSWVTFTSSSSDGQPSLSFNPSTGALTLDATLPDVTDAYAEMGLSFDSTSCVNASAFAGISFTLTGDLGGCGLLLVIEDSEGITPSQDPNRGTCTASSCAPPHYVVAGSGSIMVPFTSLTGGSPQGAIDPTAILSVQWVLGVP